MVKVDIWPSLWEVGMNAVYTSFIILYSNGYFYLYSSSICYRFYSFWHCCKVERHQQHTECTPAVQRPNSWTKSRQKSFRVFLLAIQCHLYIFACPEISISSNSRTQPCTYIFYCSVTVRTLQRRKEENLIENHITFAMVKDIHKENLSLRILKIMPKNLNEIVFSWIRLQNSLHPMVQL